MIELLSNPQTWITLVTLSAIEIVLGIDNLVFISIAVSKLPVHQREVARKFGIAVACITRIGLLLTLAWLAGLTTPLFTVLGQGISMRDLVLVLGGVFLVVKGSMEIRDQIGGEPESEDIHTKAAASFAGVIAQIAVIDIVFSLDSVIAAVGMANQTPVMVVAILAAVAVMIAASAVHDFSTGPRAGRVPAGSPEALRLRRQASLLARANALVGVGLVVAAVRLAR